MCIRDPVSRPDNWNHINNNFNDCAGRDCCEQCQVGCVDDKSCRGLGSGMKCKIREDDEDVVGCIGAAIPGANCCYSADPTCWYPPIPTPAPVATPTSPAPSRNTMIMVENCTESNPCQDLPTCAGKCAIQLCIIPSCRCSKADGCLIPFHAGFCFSDGDCNGEDLCHNGTSIPGCDEINITETGPIPPGGGFCGWAAPSTSPTRAPSISHSPSISHAPSHIREYPWPMNRSTYGQLVLLNQCPLGGCHVCSAPLSGCVSDYDCAPGLKCWNRDDSKPISGCDGAGVPGRDYCFDPSNDNTTYTTDTITKPEKPKDSNYYFTHTAKIPEQCELFAASINNTVDIPFNGASGKSFMYHAC